MATGRTDPQRRERIIAATLDLIAEEGVAGVSHRKIAARAGVPLGSMTYHFAGIDELLREAFTRFADHIVAVFEPHLGGSPTPDAAREAVADLVHTSPRTAPGAISSSPRSCTRSPPGAPAYRELTHEWMRRSRASGAALRPGTARQLDALIEGLALHRALDTEPHDRALTRLAVLRMTS